MSNVLKVVILTVAGIVVYTFLNVAIRRFVAGIRSREDYDEDVDGKMTKAEKKAAEEAKVLEAEKKKVGLKEVLQEYGIRFYVVIILGAILSGLIGFFFGLSVKAAIFFVFFTMLTAITFVDFDTMEIPPVLSWGILPLGIIAIWAVPEIPLKDRIIGAVSVSGFMLIVALIVKGGFGGGDIKLMFSAGFLLGWKGIVTGFFAGLFIGAIIGVASMVKSKKGMKDHIPFGPSLCAGLVLASLIGDKLVNWYWNIIKLSLSNPYK